MLASFKADSKGVRISEKVFRQIVASDSFNEIYVVFDYCRRINNYADFINKLKDAGIYLSVRELDTMDFDYLFELLDGVVNVGFEEGLRYLLKKKRERIQYLKDFAAAAFDAYNKRFCFGSKERR